jgi:predicted amidohydrolase YtcJ
MADHVFLNGQVVTVNSHNEVTTALAVRGNRILAVGSNEDISALIEKQTNVIDLAGRSLLPGFIDSHLHFMVHGTNRLGVNCKADSPAISSIQEKLRAKAAKTPAGEWVRGWGYNDTKLTERRHPTRWELDEVSTEHPIILVRTCAHISVCNSKALELAGINESTLNPSGGEIDRDERGIPTGLLKETAHMQVFELAGYSEDELIEALRLADQDFHQAGITSIHEAGGYGPIQMKVMQQAARSRQIKTRIYAMWGALNNSDHFVNSALETGMTTGLGDDRFRIGPAKIFTDGSSSGPTCATRQPYTSMPDYYGIQYYSQDEIDEILGKAHKLGWQITAHAMGDRAVEMMINCIDRALSNNPRTDHRHRIEHAGMVPPDLMERMAKLGIVPTPNPAFLYEFGDGYLVNYGYERVSHMFPAAGYLEKAIIAAGGSDCPVTTYDPLRGIHAAVNRRTETGQDAGTNQCISIADAIRMFTYNGAYASFDEDIKGSLEAGKLADLIILNEPILDAAPERIQELKVDMTLIDGEIVHLRNR